MSSPLITPTITSLHIVNTIDYTLSAPVLIHVLTSLPNLTELALVGRFNHAPIVAPTPRLSHPRLQALSITGPAADKVFDFLGCLDIPKAAITVVSRADREEDHIDIERVGVAFDIYRRRIPFHIHHLGLRADSEEFSIDISRAPLRHRHTINFQSWSPDEDTSAFCSALSIEKLETLVEKSEKYDIKRSVDREPSRLGARQQH
ncbi:hypothetical protein BDN72DRAFT_903816 [Pluteus cervinus]|uniref:Uncharacterized protein n=1 Tax=Pluteus cervinus TaxID=181527 RepID=A0ACD3A843_9AGAR|nr:hypothetical protein BDN72DRAFT_903816 [Pluteus cervinus]